MDLYKSGAYSVENGTHSLHSPTFLNAAGLHTLIEPRSSQSFSVHCFYKSFQVNPFVADLMKPATSAKLLQPQ
jgi:hypothetical protein